MLTKCSVIMIVIDMFTFILCIFIVVLAIVLITVVGFTINIIIRYEEAEKTYDFGLGIQRCGSLDRRPGLKRQVCGASWCTV